ncbi:MAG: hypothetical protein ACRDDE_10470 [Paraclostridium sp.]|uniref:hypothetical protein n=1 Tax=Paraclostridium sp. TaxID=2023273 RepID=UPI003EE748BE
MDKEKLNAIFNESRECLVENINSGDLIKKMKVYSDENGKISMEKLAMFSLIESMHISMEYIEIVLSKVLLDENK